MTDPAAASPSPGPARWVPPDVLVEDLRSPQGAGLLWLSRTAVGEGPNRGRPPSRGGADLPRASGPPRRRSAEAGPGPLLHSGGAAAERGFPVGGSGVPDGRIGAAPAEDELRGRVDEGAGGGARRPGRGEVATWLPEGRWATDEVEAARPAGHPVPPDREPAATARLRGQQRVRLTRVGARLWGWPRRALAAALLIAAVLVALRPGRPPSVQAPPVPARDVAVATRDLPAGTVLTAADVRTVSMPVGIVPHRAVARPAAVIGRVAAGPVRRGETITDARVVGPGLTAGLGPEESAAVPVRLAEPEAAAIVRAGDRVDVLGTAVGADGTAPVRDAAELAKGVRVLAVLGDRSVAEGVVIVVGATPATARRLAGAAARQRLTIAVRPP